MKAFFASALTVLIVAISTQAPARAEEKTRASSDTDFLVKAITCGTGEVKISEFAARHATDDKVKDFAERLMKEHQALGKTITENARRLKVAVVAGLEKETRDRMDKLARLKGNDFDCEYLRQMIDGQEKAIALFESESKGGADSDLKLVAKNNLPTLKKELQEAKEHLTRLKK